jgi:hypothetical protein
VTAVSRSRLAFRHDVLLGQPKTTFSRPVTVDPAVVEVAVPFPMFTGRLTVISDPVVESELVEVPLLATVTGRLTLISVLVVEAPVEDEEPPEDEVLPPVDPLPTDTGAVTLINVPVVDDPVEGVDELPIDTGTLTLISGLVPVVVPAEGLDPDEGFEPVDGLEPVEGVEVVCVVVAVVVAVGAAATGAAETGTMAGRLLTTEPAPKPEVGEPIGPEQESAPALTLAGPADASTAPTSEPPTAKTPIAT